MKQSQRSRSYRRATTPNVGRTKRPLIVLVYQDLQLQTLYSSSPQIQFVQLDLTPSSATKTSTSTAEEALGEAKQVAAQTLSELPSHLREEVQRAFRRSALAGTSRITRT